VPPPSPIVRYGRYGAIAFEFSGGIGAGAFIGWWLDERYGTQPYALLATTLLAVAGGFIRLIQVLRKFERSDRAREP
jgi:F0F1-type ATP synthase assembly protein I